MTATAVRKFLLFIFIVIITSLYQDVNCVISGQNAEIEQFPWHVYLIIRTNFKTKFCSGNIISKNFILTAAHCLKKKPNFVKIVPGSIETKNINDTLTISSIRYYLHPEYVSQISPKTSDGPKESSYSDIALIYVKKPIEFSKFIQPIAIPNNYTAKILAKTRKTESYGFGITDKEQKTYANVLQWAYLCTMTLEECQFYHPTLKKNDVICAFDCNKHETVSHTNVCKGDSGTGLVIQLDKKIFLIGILSLVSKNCSRYPSVFIDIQKHSNWINQVVNKI